MSDLIDTEYEPYLLQLHDNISYYSLLGLEWGANSVTVRRQIQIINDKVFPLYNAQLSEFFQKQWTDFASIRAVLYNKAAVRKYNRLRHFTRELDLDQTKPSDLWVQVTRSVKFNYMISLHYNVTYA